MPAEQSFQITGKEIIKFWHLSPKTDLPSTKPPALSSNSGAVESPDRVAAVTLSLENCSCSQATYSRWLALIPKFRSINNIDKCRKCMLAIRKYFNEMWFDLISDIIKIWVTDISKFLTFLINVKNIYD